ncbi:MAG: hypothetical protein NC201_02305 [Prevotella sp.]|nr:hypothetical protein [Bacteroides sp.]MCM1366058.1 hypothetical protein [Prevotella sp.]
MTAILIFIIRLVLVLLILVGMVMVLLGINHFLLRSDTDERQETERLRRDVKNKDYVISRYSLFHMFLAREHKSASRKQLYHKNNELESVPERSMMSNKRLFNNKTS